MNFKQTLNSFQNKNNFKLFFYVCCQLRSIWFLLMERRRGVQPSDVCLFTSALLTIYIFKVFAFTGSKRNWQYCYVHRRLRNEEHSILRNPKYQIIFSSSPWSLLFFHLKLYQRVIRSLVWCFLDLHFLFPLKKINKEGFWLRRKEGTVDIF